MIPAALALYGASLTPDGYVTEGGKTLSVRAVVKGQRIRFEGAGRLIMSGPIAADTVCAFYGFGKGS